jgi:hypothetical protein
MYAWQRTIRRRHEPLEPTHGGKLIRFLGAERVEALSAQFRHPWYGPPIPLGGVPGNVYVTAGGEFIGRIDVGDELTHEDLVEAVMRKHRHKTNLNTRRQLGAYTGLSDLLAKVSGGKRQDVLFNKVGVASNAIGNSNELWTRGNHPAAGAAGAAAPGGTAPTNASTGNWGYVNPGSANSGHLLGGWAIGGTIANSLLIIDQLLRVAKTMNSTATEAVTGTFSRYQSATATNGDYIGGNFCFPANPTTVLAATAHNWTVGQYTNQAGTTGQSFPSIAGVSACVVGGIDLAVGGPSWFMPLASGDVGVKALSQMQCSALVATGTIDFVVAHALGMFPIWVANQACMVDNITTAVDQLVNVYDNACITGLELVKPAVTAVTYTGKVTFASE